MSSTHPSATLKWILLAVATLAVALLIFHAGLALGERRALERIRPVSDGAPGPMGGGMLPYGFLPDGHGTVGSIKSIALPILTVTQRDGEEELVTVTASTTIEDGARRLAPSAITVGQQVIVIGEPGSIEDAIQAELIKVFP
jgi:hypothetical protein